MNENIKQFSSAVTWPCSKLKSKKKHTNFVWDVRVFGMDGNDYYIFIVELVLDNRVNLIEFVWDTKFSLIKIMSARERVRERV